MTNRDVSCEAVQYQEQSGNCVKFTVISGRNLDEATEAQFDCFESGNTASRASRLPGAGAPLTLCFRSEEGPLRAYGKLSSKGSFGKWLIKREGLGTGLACRAR